MTRYIRWQILLIFLGVVLVGILLTYLAVNYTTVLRPGRGGTYVEGLVGYPQYLNPLLSGYNNVDRDICALLFVGLTRLGEHGEIEGDLARKWDVELTDDGMVYTFYLRSNAFWHDGHPITADDVVFTVGLLQDPEFPGLPELGASVWQVVAVERVDRRTVRFTLPSPYAPFLDYTTMGLLPAHLLGGVRAADLPSAEFNLNPVGSGPFQLAEIQVQDETITSMVLERDERYYKARPYLDRVQFRFYSSDQAVLKAYEDGEIQGIGHIPVSELESARAMPDLNLFSAQLAEYALVILNMEHPDMRFFQEPEVRQALMYALDRELIVEQALDGQGLVAHSPFLPGSWAYKDDMSRYEQDVDAALARLEEAGWQKAPVSGVWRKGRMRLMFPLLTSTEPERVEIAHMLAEQWATIGVSVTVETASPLEIREALEARNFGAVLVHVALPGDPDPYPFWHETQIENGQNYGGFVHRRASEVMEQARITIERERREALYDEFQEIFAREVPALLLYVPVYTYGVDKRVHSVQVGRLAYPSDRFRTISDWWIVPKRVFVSEAEAEGLP